MIDEKAIKHLRSLVETWKATGLIDPKYMFAINEDIEIFIKLEETK